MWTQDALSSEARPYAGKVWRVVEQQYIAATMVLTDTLEEQARLEQLLEETKPLLPPACRGMDFLLATPFRYQPYPYGSRFRRAGQRDGAFYAAENVSTAIAEIAFYRLLFFSESPGTVLPAAAVQHTAFGADVRAARAIDLTAPPLDGDVAAWTDRTQYERCQELADAARAAKIEAIRYQSARDVPGRANVAVLSPAALAGKVPGMLQTWHVLVRPGIVKAWCEMPVLRIEFTPDQFGDPRLAPYRTV